MTWTTDVPIVDDNPFLERAAQANAEGFSYLAPRGNGAWQWWGDKALPVKVCRRCLVDLGHMFDVPQEIVLRPYVLRLARATDDPQMFVYEYVGEDEEAFKVALREFLRDWDSRIGDELHLRALELLEGAKP